jgi:hypothetical protein
MTIKEMLCRFENKKLKLPLFYNNEFGLRFDLQKTQIYSEEYFAEVIKRATILFENAFAPNDRLVVIYVDRKVKRRKIRFTNYCFRQIAGLKREGVKYTQAKNRYDKGDLYNVAIIECRRQALNYRNIFIALMNTDFPTRQPRFEFLGDVEVYFFNINNKLIFNMYDDRGLDIVADEKEKLGKFYSNYNEWLLENDRKKMELMLGI